MHWSGNGEKIGKGRGGSHKGRAYRKNTCPKCGRAVGTNVFARHVAKCTDMKPFAKMAEWELGNWFAFKDPDKKVVDVDDELSEAVKKDPVLEARLNALIEKLRNGGKLERNPNRRCAWCSQEGCTAAQCIEKEESFRQWELKNPEWASKA